MQDFYVYMLRCKDESIYTGHTDDIDKRISEHARGMCSYTAKRLPINIMFVQAVGSRDEAFNLERQLKGWSRKKKEALACSDWEGIRLMARKIFKK